ncbi:beta-lactamase-like protein [Fimicolochytrium jonesii]|uniref:beta-lactamase-like protein n=1 Tax=Fimicolochytrium jonesii TaxID=1396493 RepID=UPI0022FE3032|nr:beta-lactamase-like protein [Fimicolochytrium jonesii]KAI8826593.1 beta-lactamase-like protein [Fimicolochytrium jonesii]
MCTTNSTNQPPSSPHLPPLAPLTALTPTTTRIIAPNPGPFTLQGSNTYLLRHPSSPHTATLIDTGAAGDVARKWVEMVKNVVREWRVGELGIVLTHWHADHVGGVDELTKMAKEENITMTFHKYHTPDPKSSINSLEGTQFIPLHDGDRLAHLDIITTPGHTSDHICLYDPHTHTLFSGDCILGHGSTVFENLTTYIASLRKLLSFLPVDTQTVLYPGHGDVLPDARAAIEGYIRHRMEREAQIVGILREREGVAGVDEIVKVLYPDMPEGEARLRGAARRGLGLHLGKLRDEGRVVCRGVGGGEVWEIVDRGSV